MGHRHRVCDRCHFVRVGAVSFPLAHKIIKPRGDWVPAAATDIRKTFERVRSEQKYKDITRTVNEAVQQLQQLRERP